MTPKLDSRCLFSLEQECQTTVETPGKADLRPRAISEFLKILRGLAPSLPASEGLFNAYGRVYVDVNLHIEFAALECDSPYVLAQAVETQYELAARATAQLEENGLKLLLVNNNHSGLRT